MRCLDEKTFLFFFFLIIIVYNDFLSFLYFLWLFYCCCLFFDLLVFAFQIALFFQARKHCISVLVDFNYPSVFRIFFKVQDKGKLWVRVIIHDCFGSVDGILEVVEL